MKVNKKETSFRCNRKSGIKTYFTEFEDLEIIKWISENRKELKPISTKSLVSFAGTIKPEFKQKTLNQQLNWAYRFLKRRGFSIRRISHIGQKFSKEIDRIKEKFISDIIEQRKNVEILFAEDFKIINMDETACFLDMNSDTTIEFTGK